MKFKLDIDTSEEEILKMLTEITKAIVQAGKSAETIYKKITGEVKEQVAGLHNKAYWEGVKKSSEKALSGIDSDKKRQMDAGNFEGISDEEVEQYKVKVMLLNEATKNLKLYEFKVDPRESMLEHLSKHGEYLEKRDAMTKLYETKLSKASTAEEKFALEKEMLEALSKLDMEANKKTASISKIFGDMAKVTVKEMRKMAKEAQKTLDFIKAGNWDPQKGKELGITETTFKALNSNKEEQGKIAKQIGTINTEADKAANAFGKMGQGMKTVFKAGTNSKELKKGIAEITEGLTELAGVTKLVSGSLTKIGTAFGNEDIKDAAQYFDLATDAMTAAGEGAKAGAAFGTIGAAAGATLGVVSSVISSIGKIHDKKHEDQIKRLKIQIDALDESYRKMGLAIEKAYSNSAANLIAEQNVLLEQKKVLIQQQIAEEKSKKNTDNGKVRAYEQQLTQIDEAIQKNKETAANAIFGEDVKAAINSFAEAYANAWAAGEDKAKSSKNFVKNMIKKMIMEALKDDISKPMERIRQKLLEFWNNDGKITADEEAVIDELFEELNYNLDGKYDWADKYMKGDAKKTEATKGTFETMSQETAGELNGRFTALQMSNEEIKLAIQGELNGRIAALQMSGEEIKVMTGMIQMDMSELKINGMTANTTLLDMRDIGLDTVFHLEKINKNTAQLFIMNEKLDQVITNTNNL